MRKVGKLACKADELDAFWHDGDKVTDKCKDSVMKASGHLIGATAVTGSKNLLVLLRGDRLGELAVLDAKTLAEKKAIKMPWCTGDEAAAADEAKDDAAADEAAPETRGPIKGAARAEDPDQGGE